MEVIPDFAGATIRPITLTRANLSGFEPSLPIEGFNAALLSIFSSVASSDQADLTGS
jgi:hypothetical protein